MEVQFITSVAVITPNPTADGCTSTHSDLKGTCCAVEDVGESCKGRPGRPQSPCRERRPGRRRGGTTPGT